MKKSRFLWIFSGIVYSFILLTIIILADLDVLPTNILLKIPFYDLLGHFFLYGIGGVLAHNILEKRFFLIGTVSFPAGPLLIGFFTLIEEILQYFIPFRNASITDFAAGIVGICFFYIFFEKLIKVKN